MMAECARRLRFPGILAGRPPGFEHEKKASFDPSRMPRPASRAEEYHKPNCRGRRPRNGAARTLAARSALFHAAQDGVRGRGPPCRPPQSTWKQQQLPGKNPFALSSPRSGRVEGLSMRQLRFRGSHGREMPRRLVDRSDWWSDSGFFPYGAERLRLFTEKTLPDGSRSGVPIAPGPKTAGYAHTTAQRKTPQRMAATALHESTCGSLIAAQKIFALSTTCRNRWRSGRDSNPRPPA